MNGTIAALTSQMFFPNKGMTSGAQVTCLVSPPKRLLNALDHGKVASRPRAWCRSSLYS